MPTIHPPAHDRENQRRRASKNALDQKSGIPGVDSLQPGL
jgi:hypothetical protein